MTGIAKATRLSKLESVIDSGLRTFIEVGNALKEIRDSRLYRAKFSTFESYCRDRWGWKRAHAYRLIDGAEVASRVSPIGDITNEAQARPLTKLPVEDQPGAWSRAVEISGGKPTAKHVEAVVREINQVSSVGKKFPRRKNSAQQLESIIHSLEVMPSILEKIDSAPDDLVTSLKEVRKSLSRLIKRLEER